jgi:Spy/CpxP family protein refolding chaperone
MYNKVLYHFLGLILAGLATATWALAQPMGQPPGPPPTQAGGDRGGFQARFQEIKRTQMGPALGVSQQTVDQLLQIEQRYKPVRQQLIRDSMVEYRRLEQVMDRPAPSDQEVRAILTSIKRKQKEMQDLQARQGAEEEALLTPVQQARYLMYQRKLLKEARSVKGGGPGETAPFTPAPPRELPVSRPGR